MVNYLDKKLGQIKDKLQAIYSGNISHDFKDWVLNPDTFYLPIFNNSLKTNHDEFVVFYSFERVQ